MFDLDGSDSLPNNNVNWLDGIPLAKINDECKDNHRFYRLFGPAFPVSVHKCDWISKKTGTETSFRRLCSRFNPASGKEDRTYPMGHPRAGQLYDCPGCESSIKLQKRFYIHVIDRENQHFGKAPIVKVMELPHSVMIKIFDMKKVNKLPTGETFSPAHATYGHNVAFIFNSKMSGTDMYGATTPVGVKQEPISEVERSYPTYNLSAAYAERGFTQADPDEFRQFLTRVGLLGPNAGGAGAAAGAATTTQMPSTPFGTSSVTDDLPASWGGAQGGAPVAQTQQPQQPAFQTAGFQPQQVQQPAQPAYGFQQPAQPQQAAAFQQPQFQQPTQPQFQQPPQFAAGGFQAPAVATVASTQSGPSSRFSGPPTPTAMPSNDAFVASLAGTSAPVVAGPSQLPVVGAGHPACFRDENVQGTPKCKGTECPSMEPCFAD